MRVKGGWPVRRSADRIRRVGARLALLQNEVGATAAEYAVLIALIAAVIFAGASLLGTNVNSKLGSVGTGF